MSICLVVDVVEYFDNEFRLIQSQGRDIQNDFAVNGSLYSRKSGAKKMAVRARNKRDFPYYKIQQYDKINLTWKSYQNAKFVDEQDARDFVSNDSSANKLRIMQVEKKSAHPLD